MVRDSNLPQSTLPVGLTTPAVKVPKVNRAGFIVRDDTVTGIVGNDSGLVNESESIAASNQFLKAATEKDKPRFGRTTWLMALAGLMFIGGMAVRLVGRKSKPNV
jgi:hypothetical protein